MALSRESASFILEEASQLIQQQICILSPAGEVLASLRPEDHRLTIPVAAKAAATGEIVPLDNSQSPYWSGVAFPLYHLSSIAAVCILRTEDSKKGIDLSLVNLLKYTLEALIEKTSSGNTVVYKRRIIEGWIVNLFDPEYTDWGELESIAAEIGISTNSSSRIVVIRVAGKRVGGVASINSDASFMENYILQNIISRVHVNFYCYLGRNLYAFSISSSPMRTFSQNHVRDEMLAAFDFLTAKLEQINMSCIIGIGTLRDSLQGYRESFQEANRCVSLAMRFPQNHATSVNDWHLLNLIYQLPQPVIRSFLNQYFSNCEELKDELVETINVYFGNSCAVQKTADDLNIHKNTLLYRFRRVKEIVGLDPQDFRDGVILELWLHIRKLYPDLVNQISNKMSGRF